MCGYTTSESRPQTLVIHCCVYWELAMNRVGENSETTPSTAWVVVNDRTVGMSFASAASSAISAYRSWMSATSYSSAANCFAIFSVGLSPDSCVIVTPSSTAASESPRQMMSTPISYSQSVSIQLLAVFAAPPIELIDSVR